MVAGDVLRDTLNVFVCSGITVIVSIIAEFGGALVGGHTLFITVDAKAISAVPVSIAIRILTGLTGVFIGNTEAQIVSFDVHIGTGVAFRTIFRGTVASAALGTADRNAPVVSTATIAVGVA